nr:hypothetical protein [Tanacetum cinerariifolium]
MIYDLTYISTSSNTINQTVIQDGRVDIQTKHASYSGNSNRNAGRQNKNQAFNAGNGNDESNQIKPRVRDANYFREQMLLAMKDEAESNLKDEENDFMLDNSYGDETLEELTVVLAKKAFKERGNPYLDDIVNLEEKLSSHYRNVYKIGVESSNSVRRPKSKDTKSKDKVLKNINDKRPSTHVQE